MIYGCPVLRPVETGHPQNCEMINRGVHTPFQLWVSPIPLVLNMDPRLRGDDGNWGYLVEWQIVGVSNS